MCTDPAKTQDDNRSSIEVFEESLKTALEESIQDTMRGDDEDKEDEK